MPTFELRNNQGRILIDKDWLRVGRAEDNHVVMRDPAVSRYHLNFYLKKGQLIVEDAGSQNGFLVNGAPAGGAVLLNVGDKLFFGSQEFLVAFEGRDVASNSRPTLPRGKTSAFSSPISAGPSKRVFIYGGAAAFVFMVLTLSGGEENRSPAGQTETPDSILTPINSEGYGTERYIQKSPTDVQAEGRFNEALRDYNNENYSRALLGFQETLTLNPSHESAGTYLEKTETQTKERLNELLKDAQRSYQVLQFRRAKERALGVLTLLSDESPAYGRKIAEEGASFNSTVQKSQGQEEILLKFPCKDSREEKICSSALEVIRRSRERLGEEDVLK